jgi:hypothetical protein
VGCAPIGCDHQFVYTHKDSVVLAATAPAVKVLLGAIDTPGDARLWAWANEYGLGRCGDPDSTFTHTAAGYEFEVSKSLSDCPVMTQHLRIRVASDGTITTLVDRGVDKSEVCAGRRPDGLMPARATAADPVGRYLANMACLEAASVTAFEQLAEDLARLGAPAHLCQRALDAAEDERQHASVMNALARARGVEPPEPRCRRTPPPSRYQLAHANEVEGCVRETFGALVGRYQASHASDSAVRAAMTTIAHDEARHAALSWEVGGWVRTQLSELERCALDQARRLAIQALRHNRTQPSHVRAELGLPDDAIHAAALAALDAQLWS